MTIRYLYVAVLGVAAVVAAVALAVYARPQSTIESMRTPVAWIDTDPFETLATTVQVAAPSTRPTDRRLVARCAVINGMNITGFWKAVTDRFTEETGIGVETVTFGEKAINDGSFRGPAWTC